MCVSVSAMDGWMDGCAFTAATHREVCEDQGLRDGHRLREKILSDFCVLRQLMGIIRLDSCGQDSLAGLQKSERYGSPADRRPKQQVIEINERSFHLPASLRFKQLQVLPRRLSFRLYEGFAAIDRYTLLPTSSHKIRPRTPSWRNLSMSRVSSSLLPFDPL